MNIVRPTPQNAQRASLGILLCLLITPALDAAEGMWDPGQLPGIAAELEAAGLRADPRALANPGGYPMAAIVDLGNCSGAFVSPDGLVLTGHHCVQQMLQHNSTPDRNLVETGFLAADHAMELPEPGTRIRITVATTDVTAAITDGLDTVTDGLARHRTLQRRGNALIADCERNAGSRCEIHARHAGLRFLLVEAREIRDVRLVNAPPRSIGNYGGDVDNWTWPRHTGDYAFVRAYVSPAGEPAVYDRDNVPFRPGHYLAVSPVGLRAGDFVMTAGYPDRTYRHRLAVEARDAAVEDFPALRALYAGMIAVIERETAGREEAAIAYAALRQELENQVRKLDGMVAGFARDGLVARRIATEKAMQAWLDEQTAGFDANVLRNLQAVIGEYRAGRAQRRIYDDFLRREAALLAAASRLYRLSRQRQLPDVQRQPGFRERDVARIRADMERLDRRFDVQVDRALLESHLATYAALPAAERIGIVDRWFGLGRQELDADELAGRLQTMYADTLLDDPQVRLAWLGASPDEFEASSDPFIRLAVALYENDIAREAATDRIRGHLQQTRSAWMAALEAWHDARREPLYADADGTLRVSFGRVGGYRPHDGIVFEPFTTVTGIVQKNTGRPPFDAPAELLAAISQTRHRAAAPAGAVPSPVNFLASLDVSGGSGGAAVLDGDARLVGLVFDLTWEAINADWYYQPDIAGSISVDLRYMLWVMEKVDGAQRLLREMGIGPSTLHGRRLPAGVN